ncbi:hypothetical protein KKC06_03535 [Patescibacteria group bacterium]|nr:hypothetical protein [Patescibacteria group bacterium]
MISLLPTLGVLALVIFGIAAIIEGKSTMKKSNVIRSVYFYMASLVTLAIVIGSVIFLINLGLKSWLFTEADPVLYRIGSPPSLFLGDRFEPEVIDEAFLICEDGCILSASQKSNIATWQENYTDWQKRKSNPGGDRARDAVAALSFLIISLPIFIIHFRILQKESKKDEAIAGREVIRPTYFYFVSLSALLMIVIAGGMLINLGLKTWVFPSAGEADRIESKEYFAEPYVISEKTNIQSIVDCGEECEIDEETIALAELWLIDYTEWQNSYGAQDSTQRQAASTIPFVLLGMPLFWYHWSVVRKESKDKKEEKV